MDASTFASDGVLDVSDDDGADDDDDDDADDEADDSQEIGAEGEQTASEEQVFNDTNEEEDFNDQSMAEMHGQQPVDQFNMSNQNPGGNNNFTSTLSMLHKFVNFIINFKKF